jgi:hypothetical protein
MGKPISPSMLSLRLPFDLHAAVTQLAETAGVTTSEWLREVIYQAVYNEPQSANEGFMQGRALGMQLARHVLSMAYEHLPNSMEEAMTILSRSHQAHKRSEG